MSVRPKEEPEMHCWKLAPEIYCELRVNGALTAERLAMLRKYIDLLEPDRPYEGPVESDYPERKP